MAISISSVFEAIDEAKTVLQRKVRVVVLIVAVPIAFSAGVFVEFKYKATKEMHIFPQKYAQIEATKNVNLFVNEAKEAILNWTIYNAISGKSRSASGRETMAAASYASRLFQTINLEQLPVTWQVYAKYFYTYTQFVCADINESEGCLQNALEMLAEVNRGLKSKELHIDDVIWLNKVNIDDNLKLLTAFIFAVQFKVDPYSNLAKSNAIRAIKAIGDKEKLVYENLHNDRLLGPIITFAYPVLDEEKQAFN